jgi:inosine-uridine nucleoside N-ribohydrolase
MKKYLLSLLLIGSAFIGFGQQQRVIIDADTGNEVDDLFAVVRALIEPSWQVLGVNATQYQASHWTDWQSMQESYRLNTVLLSYLGKTGEVASKRGAYARLYDWGDRSQTSAASEYIADQAMLAADDTLIVVALGALTNVASAILDHPEIVNKMKLYWLGTSYNFQEGIMTTTDFNCVMDIQALDVVLKSSVELHIIPTNVAAALAMNWHKTKQRFDGKHELTDFLLQRWYQHMDGGRYQRTIWDLALIQAMIFPQWAAEVPIQTAADKGNRQIWMYHSIDAQQMIDEFYQSTLQFLANDVGGE